MDVIDHIEIKTSTRKTGLFILFLTEMFERFSYYGMRGLIVLYMIEETGLAFSRAEALSWYATFTLAIYIAPFPIGIITDFILKQTKAVQYGGLLLILGYSLLATQNVVYLAAGLFIITIGVSLMKPNLTVLVGRLFNKKDRKRDLGFIIFYMGINLGAFLSSMVVYQIAYTFGWEVGFYVTSFSALLAVKVFYLGKRYMNFIEEDNFSLELSDNKQLQNDHNDVITKRVLLTGLVVFIVVLFWGVFEIYGGLLNKITMTQQGLLIGDNEIPVSLFQSLNTIFIIFLSIIFLFIWKFRGSGKTIPKFGIAYILFGVGFFLLFNAFQLHESGVTNVYNTLLGVYFFHSLAEIFISPIALSYITRLSPVNYSSMIMGGYFLLAGYGNKWFRDIGDYVFESNNYSSMFSSAIIFIIFGILIFAGNKIIGRLGCGID